MALPRHLHALVKGVVHQRWSVHLSSSLSSESAFVRCLSFPSSRFYQSTSLQHQQRKTDDGSGRDIVESREKPFSELTLGQKVTRASKDATYTGIVIGGIAVTGFMFYAIGRELFSGQSPNGIYSRAFKLCKNNEQVLDAIGEPIKGYGEMTSRGRRRHVRHVEYEADGVKHMKMQFYLEGPQNKATVQLEAKQDQRGKYQFRYLFVELQNYPRKTIVVQDNR